MKFLAIGVFVSVCTISMLAQTAGETAIKVRGCLQGDGSAERPWTLAGVALPAPVTAAPTGGGAGRGGGRGAGGRGGAAAPAAPAPDPPRISLRLSGMNMSPWRGMRVELEGSLVGARPATGPQEFRAVFARSAYGSCPAQ